jgi:hypothetical protein
VVFVENVRWNVGVVTANKQVGLLWRRVSDFVIIGCVQRNTPEN